MFNLRSGHWTSSGVCEREPGANRGVCYCRKREKPARDERAFELIPAATYSPTQFPVQYHQLRRA